MTKDEINKRIDELKYKANVANNYQMAMKLTLNSIYGAFGNPWFYFKDIDVAESITQQGKHAILYTEESLNRYFYEFWHKDADLHKKMGVKVTGKVENPVVIYMDTDSTFSDAFLYTLDGDVTIEQYWNRNAKVDGYTIDPKGNEVVHLDKNKINDPVLNWTDSKKLHYVKVKKAIRHKVTKSKWRLKTKSGKEVIVTGDHSLVVFREGKQITIKAKDVNPATDKALTVYNAMNDILKNNYLFEEIESCECIGQFEDEYVYDIEVDDESHTFIANDILVHNSCYVTFGEVMDTTDWEGDEKSFVHSIYEHRLKDFNKTIFQKYADTFGTDNFLDFELESIAKNGVWMAKKNYIQNIIWKDGKDYDELVKIKVTGWDAIKSSTPKICRQYMNEILPTILGQTNFDMGPLVDHIRKIKKIFMLADIEDISANKKVNKLNKYVINDTTKLEFAKKAQGHVKAAGYYNYVIKNSEYKNKYKLIKSGDKCRIYETKNNEACEVFAYLPGEYPYEIAPEIDRDAQFEKYFIDPINRIVKAIGHEPLDRHLVYANTLF